MKRNILFPLLLITAVLNAVNSLIKNGNNNSQPLVPEVSTSKNASHNEDTCEIQKMAEEMIENLLNEKDVLTLIMEPLQNKLNDDYICEPVKYNNICIYEKDKTPLTFQCTSEKYENLIHRFTYKKLCRSKITYCNILLKSFIDKNKESNTFDTIINNYNVLLSCVDSDLKAIYKESISLLSDLRDSIIDITEKLWSKNISDVFKKREQLITGIFCELRNGNTSNLISHGLSYENFGILKINNEKLLNQAFDAFSEYYYYFPLFAIKLLEKGGFLERLVSIHANLTNYRAKNIIKKINDKSRNEVLSNDDLFTNLNNYKHHNQKNTNSFINITGTITEDNLVEGINDFNKIDSNLRNDSTTSMESKNTNILPPKDTNTNNLDNKNLSNPLSSPELLKTKDVSELVKDMIKSLNIVKFENDQPTNKTDEEGIKKLIENSFMDLSDNSMLVRLLLKPQAAILYIIQSFILMTPSPTRDAKTYCKKSLVNGQLIDTSDANITSEEDDLINNFASKYNLIYEKLIVEELRENEQNTKTLKTSQKKLSALEVRNTQNNNPNGGNTNSPLIAVVSDPNGEETDAIINNNVNLSALSTDIEQTFKTLSSTGTSFSSSVSYALFALLSIFLYFI
ncbi:GPI-anchored micronemal antigen, putative [Plasmodium berghei]|uniref:GPI-anchored micronemal antigen, putative n=2 Tax=Plasmodium berghei TaxID=5821 RepID=A0A509AJI2_PLABA|nr:GPI-anchored micronemal antigen, putative [Plasmodium berghei ANKA]SCM20120.1 GPI-anchored micronemal antigen, putative [Plasmodium berghei]SCN23766.1 GPI-anchored micronemal antigen, putative [Plasmodium berghei]SCO60129.1 GPI-anchored micronemal antigen, putative [Plasmodium berghei]VUC54946.1 GPI-anchored micronemal antigen, putative [Plasmodium berghei ANKA]|eukprot:XP_034420765.1 GPI-anchored micronemal antigen, putative [Plasmodium berghei ANKA]